MTYCYKVNNREEYDRLIKYLHDNGAVWQDSSKMRDWTPEHVRRDDDSGYPIFMYNDKGVGYNLVYYGTNENAFASRINGEAHTEHETFVLATVAYKLKYRNIKE